MNDNYKKCYYNTILILYTGFVKLILEVFGASGAVWGFAEVLTLRNEDTVEFWRYVCLVVAFIFLLRYTVVMMLFSKHTFKKNDENLPK